MASHSPPKNRAGFFSFTRKFSTEKKKRKLENWMGCRKLTYSESLPTLKVVSNNLKISVKCYAGDYRYGYQGSEKDDEVKGSGNSYTTHFRQLDPRVGRWLSIDPMASSMPYQSPYCSMDNSPVQYNDPNGDYIRYGAKGKSRRKLKADIRAQKKIDPSFKSLVKEWRRDNDRHSLWTADQSSPTGGAAQQDSRFNFVRTNSNHNVGDKLRGEGEDYTYKKPKLIGKGFKEKNKEINKVVVNHHHYIGTPDYTINIQSFDVDFQSNTNNITNGIDELSSFIDSNPNVLSIDMKLGTTSSNNNKLPSNQGFTIDGNDVLGGKPTDLLKGRENAIENAIGQKSRSTNFSFSGKNAKNTSTSVKSTVTVRTITYN